MHDLNVKLKDHFYEEDKAQVHSRREREESSRNYNPTVEG